MDEIIVKIFEENQAESIVEDSEPLFKIYSTGMALGHVKWNGIHDACPPRNERMKI